MKNAFSLFGVLGILLVVLAIFAGWGMNLMAVVDTVNGPITGTFILRVVGLFVFPLGAIFGWVM